ncbi:hypothetical protein FHX42_003919, partial [Saccharopolyspora lacisalsi]|nr:hypothetical protein [Halosaccharopolyspora lacisalsi]
RMAAYLLLIFLRMDGKHHSVGRGYSMGGPVLPDRFSSTPRS